MAEEARLESVWPPKGAREFESRSLRKDFADDSAEFFLYYSSPPVPTLRQLEWLVSVPNHGNLTQSVHFDKLSDRKERGISSGW